MAKLNFSVKVLSITVFLVGLFAFVQTRWKSEAIKGKSFVITYKLTEREVGIDASTTGLAIRAVDGDGNWKETRYQLRDGSTTITCVDSIASYRVAGSNLEYIDSAEQYHRLDQMAHDPNYLTSKAIFDRREQICGLEAYVWHQADSTAGDWLEEWYSSRTGFTPLKTVEHMGRVDRIREAVSIQFRDLAPEEMALPSLPVSFRQSDKLIGAMRACGGDNAASADGLNERTQAVRAKLVALQRQIVQSQ